MNIVKALLSTLVLFTFGCTGGNDNAHTTATTFVPPPERQALHIESKPSKRLPAKPEDPKKRVDLTKPLMIFNFADQEGLEFLGDFPVVIDFSLANAQLKGDGGEFRVRYIVDDEDMRWIDAHEMLVLTGWTPGKHKIRLELIGPDGWPYRNGDYNLETREFSVVK